MTEPVYLSGMLKWCRPDKADKFGKFSTALYLDKESLEKFNHIKETKKIKNNLNRDDDGDFIRCSTVTSKQIRGKTVHFAISVLGPDGRPLVNTPIGNGSTGTIKMDLYPYNTPAGQKEWAWRWSGVKVSTLIPFQSASLFPDEQKLDAKASEPVW